MKFSTFYFSGTGNTEWAVRQFHQILQDNGHESRIISIDKMYTNEASFYADIVRTSDLVGFANPIYGGNIPPVMREFIAKLAEALADEKEYSRKVYYINTFAYINGFGPFCTKKLLKNTAFKLISYVNIRICNNISTPKIKVDTISEEKLYSRKKAAQEELTKMMKRLLSGKSYITGIGPYLIPNIIIREKSKQAIAGNYKVLGIDTEACSKCMKCVKNCPTKSIEYKAGKFKFLPTCTACMRCYNNCPTYSILFNGEFADPKKYQVSRTW